MGEEVKEECGIAAVQLKKAVSEFPVGGAAEPLYRLLLQQQNRGQLSAGITTFNPQRPQLINTYRDVGLVNEVFRSSNEPKFRAIMEKFSGTSGIGQTRYATFGKDTKSYAQPFERKHGRKWKWFSFAFNGNIANYAELRRELEEKSFHFQLHSDTEVIMHHLAYGLRGEKKTELVDVFGQLAESFDGAYNIVFVNADGDIAVARDAFGIRPLNIAQSDEMIAAASESSALSNIHLENIQTVQPGEMIQISPNGGMEKKRFAKRNGTAHCMFEWVYFANVASEIDGKSVYEVRYRLGKELSKLEKEKITEEHIVVPVPDTARAAADAFGYELGIPVKEGLLRNRFVGRTFIESNNRMEKAKAKYAINKSVLQGKKVFLVEDSIVRGTTTKTIVDFIKKVGKAKEVHVRVSCPPIRFPCFYGIDMSTVSELIISRHAKSFDRGILDVSEETEKSIAKEIGADSVIYQKLDGLVKAIGFENGERKLCLGCLTGKYPTPKGNELVQIAVDNAKKGVTSRTYESVTC